MLKKEALGIYYGRDNSQGKSVAIKVVGRRRSAEAVIEVLCFRSYYTILC
jgi:hypothetical protein